jgi:hypothetical protein
VGLLGLGVAGLAVGGAMTGLTIGAQGEVERGVSGMNPVWTPELQQKEQDALTYQTLSIAMYAVGGVAAAAGAVLLGLSFSGGKSRASLAPSFGPRSAGLVLQGAF